jgi:hypothetical protein
MVGKHASTLCRQYEAVDGVHLDILVADRLGRTLLDSLQINLELKSVDELSRFSAGKLPLSSRLN